ncbi:hypothetical protein D3C87_1269730 [compost metagenome]
MGHPQGEGEGEEASRKNDAPANKKKNTPRHQSFPEKPGPESHESQKESRIGIPIPHCLPGSKGRANLNRMRMYSQQRIAGAGALVHGLLLVPGRHTRDRSIEHRPQHLADLVKLRLRPLPIRQQHVVFG